MTFFCWSGVLHYERYVFGSSSTASLTGSAQLRRPGEHVWNLKQNREDAGRRNLILKGIRFEGRKGIIKS